MQGSTGITFIAGTGTGTGIGKKCRDRDFAGTGIITGTGIVTGTGNLTGTGTEIFSTKCLSKYLFSMFSILDTSSSIIL
jgi:hypothetical protein